MSKRPNLRIVGEDEPVPTGKPRPANMFQSPQESSQAPMRDKLLFTEAMMASAELTGRQQRIAFLLTSLWTHTHGAAYPSMRWIADALTLDKRNVVKDLAVLEAKGWFIVEHGTRGRGKNHVNRYRPNVEKVSSTTPFKTAVLQAEQSSPTEKRCQSVPEKVSKQPGKGVISNTRSGLTLSGVLRTDTDDLRSSPCSQDVDADSDPDFVVLKKLKGYDAWLKAGSDKPLTPGTKRAVEEWMRYCDALCEIHDSHSGDGIGGMAYRLSQEFAWLLDESGGGH